MAGTVPQPGKTEGLLQGLKLLCMLSESYQHSDDCRLLLLRPSAAGRRIGGSLSNFLEERQQSIRGFLQLGLQGGGLLLLKLPLLLGSLASENEKKPKRD